MSRYYSQLLSRLENCPALAVFIIVPTLPPLLQLTQSLLEFEGFLSTSARFGASSSVIITYCALCLFLSYSGMFTMARIGTISELYGTIFRSGGKMSLKNFSITERTKRTGTAELSTMPKIFLLNNLSFWRVVLCFWQFCPSGLWRSSNLFCRSST